MTQWMVQIGNGGLYREKGDTFTFSTPYATKYSSRQKAQVRRDELRERFKGGVSVEYIKYEEEQKDENSTSGV